MPHRIGLYLHHFHQIDSALCVRVNRTSRNRWVRIWFRIISRLGDGVFWYAIMAGIMLAQGETGLQACLHMAAAGLAGTLLYKWLKGKTLRPRPYEVHQDIWLTGRPLDRFSFPSGHTLHAVLFNAILLVYYPVLAWLAFPFTLMVAASRVVLGLHYPSDVLAGAVIGILVAIVSFQFLPL